MSKKKKVKRGLAIKKSVKAKKAGKAGLLLLMVSVLVIMVILTLAFLFFGQGKESAAGKISIENPLEDNTFLFPIISRAVVLNMKQGYQTAIDTISGNKEFIKNNYSAMLSLAELYREGLKDYEKALAIYSELLNTYQDQSFVHNIITYEEGRIQRTRLFLYSGPEVLMRIAQIRLEQGAVDEAKSLLKRIESQYRKAVFGRNEQERLRYQTLIDITLAKINAENAFVWTAGHEINRVKTIEKLLEICSAYIKIGDFDALARSLGDEGVSLGKKTLSKKQFADEMRSGVSEEAVIARKLLQENNKLSGIVYRGKKGDVYQYTMIIINEKKEKLGEVTAASEKYGWKIIKIQQCK